MPRKPPTVIISKRAFNAVIFDLDGVIAKTMRTHRAAWKILFDAFLKQRAERLGEPFQAFDADADYRLYVDGKPRYEGVKRFLESRGIELPFGAPDDAPDEETVCGLGNKKNGLFREALRKNGVEVYASSIRLLRRLRAHGIKTAVVSASKNCATVLEAAAITHLFDARVDGIEAARLDLEGKPAPDTFLEAARRLNVEPAHAVVVEDAIAGVQAGRRGGFGLVIGVDRTGHAAALLQNGAAVVVTDMAEVVVSEPEADRRGDCLDLPSALERFDEIAQRLQGRRAAVFLDYDGTLTPIVQRPELAVLSNGMRERLKTLARRCAVAVVTGRDLQNIKNMVGIDGLIYAGSHGFDISGPGGLEIQREEGVERLPDLDQAETALHDRLSHIPGILLERKQFAIAVHYREVAEEDIEAVDEIVESVARAHPGLRQTSGKKIFELQPNVDWHKGRAVQWLLQSLNLGGADVEPFFIGDDRTDEDAFRALREHGVGILVSEVPRHSEARYRLEDTEQVGRFLDALAKTLEAPSNE